MVEPTSYLLYKLLELNSIKVDRAELDFQYQSHPSYPSLHSITGVLNHFNIDNLAIEVPTNEETLDELPGSFIAHTKDVEGEHFVLVNQSGISIELVFNKGLKKNITKEAFLRSWTGIMVAVEKPEDFIQSKEQRFYIKAIYITGAIIALLILFQNGISRFGLVHLLIAAVGVIISVVIVQHELGVHSVVIDKFCSGSNEKSSCDDVLNSKGATVIGNIKFSDIGLVYFVGVVLSWFLLSFIKSPNANLLFALSLAAMPFTVYSLIYQRFVVKKWCPLCLSTLIVLWAHGASLFLYKLDNSFYQLNSNSILAIIFSFIIVGLLWTYLYPMLKSDHEHKKLKIEHNRFKNNFELFHALLSTQPTYNVGINNKHEIILGNKSSDSLLKIVLVTNPLCSHCIDAYHAIEPLLKLNNKDVQICIRFNVNINDMEGDAPKIALTLINIYHSEKSLIAAALQELHSSTTSRTDWLNKWGAYYNNNYIDVLKDEKRWCVRSDINFTPMFLINGKSYPKEYNRDDIRLFFEELIEYEKETTLEVQNI